MKRQWRNDILLALIAEKLVKLRETKGLSRQKVYEEFFDSLEKWRSTIISERKYSLLEWQFLLQLELRDEYGHTQEFLIEKVHLDINRYEICDRIPTLMSLRKICEFYDVTLAEFFLSMNYPPKTGKIVERMPSKESRKLWTPAKESAIGFPLPISWRVRVSGPSHRAAKQNRQLRRFGRDAAMIQHQDFG